MSRTCVCDASVVVAMLVDVGPDGRWASAALSSAELVAPTLLPFECSNVLRRQELSGRLRPRHAASAHADLLALAIELWPYDVLAARVWDLRSNVSSYDASYVALAEMLAVPLITLDRRLARAPGLGCDVLVPSSS